MSKTKESLVDGLEDQKNQKRRDSAASIASESGYQGDTSPLHSVESSAQASPVQSPQQSSSALFSLSSSMPPMNLFNVPQGASDAERTTFAEKVAFLRGLSAFMPKDSGVGMGSYEALAEHQTSHGESSDTEPEINMPSISFEPGVTPLTVNTQAEKYADAPVMPTGPENIVAPGFTASAVNSIYNVSATPFSQEPPPGEFPNWKVLAANLSADAEKKEQQDIKAVEPTPVVLSGSTSIPRNPRTVPLPQSPRINPLDVPLPPSPWDDDCDTEEKSKTKKLT